LMAVSFIPSPREDGVGAKATATYGGGGDGMQRYGLRDRGGAGRVCTDGLVATVGNGK